MSEMAVLREALDRLRKGLDGIQDPFARTQLRLASDLMQNSVASDGVNPARVSDIAFAFHDLSAGAADLTGADAELVNGQIDAISHALETLKASVALPGDLIAQMRALQAKLRIRRTAIERQTYVENDAAPLPHSPEELKIEAIPIQHQLAAAGFSTPALDALVDDPESLRFRTIGDLIDELDVIAEQ